MSAVPTEFSNRSLLPIQVQSIWLAIDAGHVREILGTRNWVAIPGASSEIPGVIPWRGRAVAVLDLAAMVPGLRHLDAQESRSRTVILNVAESLLALLVDAAREVQEVPRELLRQPHATHQPLATSEVMLNGTVMPLLNLHDAVERVTARTRKSA